MYWTHTGASSSRANRLWPGHDCCRDYLALDYPGRSGLGSNPPHSWESGRLFSAFISAMLWCLYALTTPACFLLSYITCKNINTGIRGFVVGINVSTWGRNPSRAMSTAGARMLARLAAPGHTQRPRRPRPGGRQHTARKPRSNPLHAHVYILSDSLQVPRHKYWDVTGCAHRLRRTGRALRSKRARRMRVAASKL